MLDLKLLRNNKEILVNSLKHRNSSIDVNEIFELDVKVREHQTKSQELASERNKLAKEIGLKKQRGENADDLLSLVAKSKKDEEELVLKTKELEEQLYLKLAIVPNILHESVPYGVDETQNIEVRKFMEPQKFNFAPKEHFDLGVELDMMDFETAAQMAGSRFTILSKDLAKLERALIAFMLDIHTTQNGYTEYSMPTVLKPEALYNTGQLPKFKEDLFETLDNRFLIPTTEVPLTNLVANKFILEQNLPIRATGQSLCFRLEAGSAGRDAKGMLRQHQFYKVELVSITKAEDSFNELEKMVNSAEEILKQLQIPYKVMLLCSGDTGFSASKTYDIEAWLPGQNKYREISSCSNCTDFQARRMNAKLKDTHGNNHHLLHTLNGSGLAVGRTLIAILENYQNADGSINVPDVLVNYMGGKKVINKI
jgi:seryl-tRNA synthetase